MLGDKGIKIKRYKLNIEGQSLLHSSKLFPLLLIFARKSTGYSVSKKKETRTLAFSKEHI